MSCRKYWKKANKPRRSCFKCIKERKGDISRNGSISRSVSVPARVHKNNKLVIREKHATFGGETRYLLEENKLVFSPLWK
jgi:hypothetical protein